MQATPCKTHTHTNRHTQHTYRTAHAQHAMNAKCRRALETAPGQQENTVGPWYTADACQVQPSVGTHVNPEHAHVKGWPLFVMDHLHHNGLLKTKVTAERPSRRAALHNAPDAPTQPPLQKRAYRCAGTVPRGQPVWWWLEVTAGWCLLPALPYHSSGEWWLQALEDQEAASACRKTEVKACPVTTRTHAMVQSACPCPCFQRAWRAELGRALQTQNATLVPTTLRC